MTDMLHRLSARALAIAFVFASFAPLGASAAAPKVTCTAAATSGAGNLTGTIASVDFDGANALVCVASGRSTTGVLVTPGTLIQIDAAPKRGAGSAAQSGSYRTITDLKPGEYVKIFTALAGGKLTASIVILAK